MGFPAEDEPRPGHQRPVCWSERHRQDHGGRGDRQRAAAEFVPYRPVIGGSKYIGETEKNLRRLFHAAEEGGAILFFDEADVLFGKRSEVKDSHDRYANIEINYLFQRMEAYHGLAILATNLKSALDPAFLRRLRFIANFPFPGPGAQEIWAKRSSPPKRQLQSLDYDRLARCLT